MTALLWLMPKYYSRTEFPAIFFLSVKVSSARAGRSRMEPNLVSTEGGRRQPFCLMPKIAELSGRCGCRWTHHCGAAADCCCGILLTASSLHPHTNTSWPHSKSQHRPSDLQEQAPYGRSFPGQRNRSALISCCSWSVLLVVVMPDSSTVKIAVLFLGCTLNPTFIICDDVRKEVGVCCCEIFEFLTNVKLLLLLVIREESRHKLVHNSEHVEIILKNMWTGPVA